MTVGYVKWILLMLFVLLVPMSLPANSFGQWQFNNEVKLGLSYILSFKGVAKDLELSEEQTDQLIGSWIEVKSSLERAFRNYQANFSPRFSAEEKKDLETALADEIKKIRESETEKLTKVLLPHQLARLKQIQFQILRRDGDGMQGLADALKLTKDQIKQLKTLKTDLAKSIQKLRNDARKDQLTPNEVKEKLEAIQSQSKKDVLNVLSALQRDALRKLEGEPFELQTTPAKTSERK